LLLTMQLRKSDFHFAMDRLDDFKAVHTGEQKDEQINALDTMLEFIGLGDSAKIDLMHWIQDKDGHGQEGGFLLGIAIGIIATQKAIEKDI
jgi:hypothetical protein